MRDPGRHDTRREEPPRCERLLYLCDWLPPDYGSQRGSYCGHPNDGRVVSTFVIQGLLEQDITVYGDRSQTRSFCYVDDLIDGLVRLMKTPAYVTGPINIGNPNEFTMLGLAEMIMELTNSRSKIVYRPLPQDDPKQRRPDISRASTEFHWSPRVGLREGLIFFAIAATAWLFQEEARFQRNRPLSILEWAGTWSYSLYLVHPLAMDFYRLLPSDPSGSLAGLCANKV